jgi:hypothetical protein
MDALQTRLQRIATARKQHQSHEDFVFLHQHIEAYCPRPELDRLVDRTVEDIRAFCRGRNAAFAWSGGKDSAALYLVATLAGIDDCVIGISDLEYPAFLQWVTDWMPDRLEVVNSGLDLPWLARNLGMLFPQEAEVAAEWFRKIQHTAQETYYRRRGVEVLVLGRRLVDGNFVGRGANHYTARGITRFSPIAHWDHGHVLAAVKYHGIPLPPFYQWPRGFRCGTHSWPARQWCRDRDHGFAEVHAIDPAILPEAGRYLEPAARWLERH